MNGDPPIQIAPIGYVTTSYTDLSGTPSQASENTQATGTVVLRTDLVDALLGLERYPFLWLITLLHRGGGEEPRLFNAFPGQRRRKVRFRECSRHALPVDPTRSASASSANSNL